MRDRRNLDSTHQPSSLLKSNMLYELANFLSNSQKHSC
jgi:hypothetical protein